jgi:hypothetical protein
LPRPLNPAAPAATALLLALAATAPAIAQTNYPVDDFEILPFTTIQSGVGTVTDILAVPPPAVGHVISTTRRVTCTVFSGSNAAGAQLVTGGFDDAVALSVFPNTQVSLVYPLSSGGPDLAAGGTVDRIEMDVRRLGGGAVADVACELNDTSAVGFLVDKSIANSASFTVLTWPLTAFSSLDLQNITKISFLFPDAGNYDVREIRLRGTSSTDIHFELYEEATITPPLPSPPVAMGIFDAALNPLFDLDFAITQADAGFTPGLQWAWSAEPLLAGETLHGVLDWTDGAPFDLVQLAFSVEVSGGAGGLFPELYPPDPFHGPEGITLVFPVHVRDAPGGNLVGSAEAWLTIDPGPDQAETAMEFADVMVTTPVRSGPVRSGSGMDRFDVSFLLVPGAAGVETIWPILQTRAWMDWTEDTSTAAPGPVVSARGATTLTAVPTITRAGTEIRGSRPFGRAATLLVHDVAGRRLAALHPAAGARSVRWDGRDEAGRALPAGVYFVRLAGADTEAARVVRIR